MATVTLSGTAQNFYESAPGGADGQNVWRVWLPWPMTLAWSDSQDLDRVSDPELAREAV